MSFYSAYSAQRERTADLDRTLRDLEQRFARLSRAASRSAPGTVDRVSDTVVTALNDIAERFRGKTPTAGEVTQLADDALRLGNDALRRLTREVEHRPLLTLAVAVGVGALVVGLLSRR
jgi:ElaB/YqjD/DUF883 family membrane-anchored ribosome-binding protein